MSLVLALGAAALGAIIGSFLNALSFRFNTGRGMGGRSRCMHCRHTLGALDLIPVLSFVFLRGRCRYCGAKISFQYPVVEVAGAILAVSTYFSHPIPLGHSLTGEALEFFFWLTVWMMLLFIVVYDIRHGIIPWSFSLPLIVLALLYLFFTNQTSTLDLLAGPLLALPLFLISLVSKGTWMGWGDSILELSLGFLLGLAIGASALMLAFWSGALVGIVLIVLKKGFKLRSEIPFAPFLVLGAYLAHTFHVDLFSSFSLLW